MSLLAQVDTRNFDGSNSTCKPSLSRNSEVADVPCGHFMPIGDLEHFLACITTP